MGTGSPRLLKRVRVATQLSLSSRIAGQTMHRARRVRLELGYKNYLCGSALPPPLNASLEVSPASPGIGEGASAPLGTIGSGKRGGGA